MTPEVWAEWVKALTQIEPNDRDTARRNVSWALRHHVLQDLDKLFTDTEKNLRRHIQEVIKEAVEPAAKLWTEHHPDATSLPDSAIPQLHTIQHIVRAHFVATLVRKLDGWAQPAVANTIPVPQRICQASSCTNSLIDMSRRSRYCSPECRKAQAKRRRGEREARAVEMLREEQERRKKLKDAIQRKHAENLVQPK